MGRENTSGTGTYAVRFLRATALAVACVVSLWVGAARAGSWSELPLYGGDVSSIAVDPANASHLIAGTFKGGVFVSNDGGAHWTLSNRGFAGTGSNEVFSVVFDPSTSANVYAATNDGVWKSTNGGGVWAQKSTGLTTSFAKTIAVDPSTPSIVYAGTTNGGVFKSTNGAGSWSPMSTGLTSTFITALVVDPTNPSTVYAATGSGVGKTTNGGGSWSMVNTGLPSTTIGPLAMDPTNDQVLYAGTVFSGVAKTTDGGAHWAPMNNGLSATNIRSLLVFGGNVFAGTGSGLFLSGNGASSWSESDNGLNFATAVALTGVGGTVYAGTGDQGIFNSTDAGGSWNPINTGLVNVVVSQVQVDPTVPPFGTNVPNAIYAQTGEFNDIYKSVGGAPFALTPENGLPFGINPGTLQLDPGSPNTLLVGTRPVGGSGGGLYQSTDGGDNWSLISLASGTQPNIVSVSNIVDTSSGAVAGAGDDQGTSYLVSLPSGAAMTTAAPSRIRTSDTESGNITETILDPYSGNLWVARVLSNGDPTIRVVDHRDGTSTGFTTAGLDTGEIKAFDFKGAVTYLVQNNKIFRFDPSVNTWKPTGVEGVGFSEDVRALVDPPGALYAGTAGSGVFINTDPSGAGTWTAMNSGLGSLYVNALAPFPGSSYLVAGTDGGGVWAFGALPPRTRFTNPTSLTRPVSATFSTPVKNITSADLALRVTGTTANLAATVTCKNGSATVSCSNGPVTSATLQPAAALIPGQQYTTVINPAGASGQITDTVGDPAVAASSPFRASTNEQETSAAAHYAWKTVSDANANGGSYTVERRAGASASFSFTGTSVSWITVDGPDQGQANVYIDGALQGTFNQYAATPSYNVSHAFAGLASAQHTITIKVLGTKGSTSATDTRVAIDAFQVGLTLSATPAATYSWQLVSASAAAGGRYANSDLAGTTVSFKFRGAGITWYTILGPSQGKANVSIDGTPKGTFDNYASTSMFGQPRNFTGLSDAVHTLTITTLGTKQAASKGTLVSVDRWIVS